MSTAAQPISPSQFALAIQDLPLENLYTKVAEIRNSISHLERSNKELAEYAQRDGNEEDGDADLVAAIEENKTVVGRMNERIDLVKAEVERRGQIWHEGDNEPATTNGEGAPGRSRGGQGSSDVEDDHDGVHL